VNSTFRFALAIVLATAMLDGAAQSAARSRPPGTVPLEEAPPPPPMDPAAKDDADPKLQPQVTTRTEGDKTIQEYRIRGKLYMMRVTPRTGRGYVLMDNKGDGTFTRQDNTLDQGIRVPQWVLLEF
jgi:hypothetical protein